MAVKTFTVTVVNTGGGNKYFIDGVQQATVALARGATYKFDQSDSSNSTHPLVFSSDSGNSTPYTTGVTTNGTPGSSGAYTEIAVATSAPSNLYYYCSNHAGMGGAANITSDSYGALTWNTNAFGSSVNTVSITGIAMAGALGTPTETIGDANIDVTGIAMTTTQGSVSATGLALVTPTGISLTSSEGTVDVGPDASVTGVQASMALGTLDAFHLEGWGRQQWNSFAWGISGTLLVTGNQATTNTGSVDIQAGASAGPATNNGQTITGALGTPVIDIQSKVFPVGVEMSSTLGTADAGPDAMATGNQATASLGTIDAFNAQGWGRQQWNVNAWGVEGQFANIDVTGVAMSSNLGSVSETISGNANVTANTLNVAQVTIANVDPAPDAMITGNFMIGSLGQLGMQGDVPQDVTGIAMSANLGTLAVDLNTPVDVTGIAMSASLGNENIVIHVDVPLTGNTLTMGQGSGSALIWNEVNTGTAPIDPPGWTEVAA